MSSWHSAYLIKHRDNFTLTKYKINIVKYFSTESQPLLKSMNLMVLYHCTPFSSIWSAVDLLYQNSNKWSPIISSMLTFRQEFWKCLYLLEAVLSTFFLFLWIGTISLYCTAFAVLIYCRQIELIGESQNVTFYLLLQSVLSGYDQYTVIYTKMLIHLKWNSISQFFG
jgi:hypothetical protein